MNYTLEGIKYSELVELLGEPDSGDSTWVSYEITLRKNSIVNSCETEEWLAEIGRQPKRVMKPSFFVIVIVRGLTVTCSNPRTVDQPDDHAVRSMIVGEFIKYDSDNYEKFVFKTN
ncbi:MAG TPA: hypothetical protein VFE50_25425 [Cyclobacteriaceae bacterium]|nr:hypothetical protein [Cyclobacteriaceae bacterium]